MLHIIHRTRRASVPSRWLARPTLPIVHQCDLHIFDSMFRLRDRYLQPDPAWPVRRADRPLSLCVQHLFDVSGVLGGMGKAHAWGLARAPSD